ncbi:hypothetical protein VTJ49DRAFT_4623 [Mycothermus thermophilus]|uniref:Heterokaryon incompatibility domain-containing protein n=1 Tax=Humicola insolens TaxID=85995 RepID=A0ABR3V5I4_HUMIN
MDNVNSLDQLSLRCPHCQDLTQCYLALPTSKLLEGVDEGCRGCCLLKDAVSNFVPISLIETIRVSVDCALYIYAFFKELRRYTTIELSSTPGKPSRWKNIGPARPVLLMADDKGRIVDLIKHWIEDCQLRHPSCQVRPTAVLPARVIDVGTSSETVSLYISAEGETGSYVALSHCWGGHTPLATTKATLAEHRKSLRFDDKSKTFAQAVELTRALGFRYLWHVSPKRQHSSLAALTSRRIDSLCIVQDDPNDWAVEAAKMKQVYNNAALTLSADGAEDTSQGLFANPSARAKANQTVTLMTEDATGQPVEIHARLRCAPPSDPDSAPHSSYHTQPSKLSTRGWVVQERILSPRMVHFYNEELVWSCFGLQRCECRLLAAASSSGTLRRILTMASSPTPSTAGAASNPSLA